MALALSLSALLMPAAGAQSFGVYGASNIARTGGGVQVQSGTSTAGTWRLSLGYEQGGAAVAAERLNGFGAGRTYWGAGAFGGYAPADDRGAFGGVRGFVGAELPTGGSHLYGEVGVQAIAAQTSSSDIGVVGGLVPVVRVGVRF
ncbi:hypothetical protein GCM10017783_22670 [Deinococcus piscis]|uniref:Uncharacterized protein n=1 Tax=Deinococcus piscis TaxID=394230 RepID=A0ABQ3KA39_9DEIO|nr:hypothetical protein GCM10017783_22670 [Deinococcus piscis]